MEMEGLALRSLSIQREKERGEMEMQHNGRSSQACIALHWTMNEWMDEHNTHQLVDLSWFWLALALALAGPHPRPSSSSTTYYSTTFLVFCSWIGMEWNSAGRDCHCLPGFIIFTITITVTIT
jgi:hypothetical protein